MQKKQSKAKTRAAIDINAENRKKEGVKSLFMMLLGAVIAGMVGVFFYLSPFLGQKKSPPLNEPVKVTPITTEATPTEEYRFYEVLPKQEFQSTPDGTSIQDKPKGEQNQTPAIDKVVKAEPVPDEVVVVEEEQTYEASITIAPKTTPKTTYILQVRSFETADEADQKRAEVMMAGVDARVVKRDVNGETLYQVVSTPINSKDELMESYNRLQSSGIDSVVVEQNH